MVQIDEASRFDEALAGLDVEQFWRDGWAVLHNAYSPDEIERMRPEAREQNARGGDLAGGPLEHVLTDGRMTRVAQKLLGTDQILYGGDSSATINGKIRVWHKDNTDRDDPNAPDWDDERYSQLRFGIYLQDHTEHTGGLNLKIGSHLHCDTKTGETIYVRSAVGDLLVWSLKSTHSGAATLLKDPDARDPEPNEWDKFSDDEVTPAHDERMAVFVHLGADDRHGRRYLDYLRTRTYMVGLWRRAPWSKETVDNLTRSGLVARNMPAEVMDDPHAGHAVQWEPYWYPGWTPPAVKAAQASAPKAAPKSNAPRAAAPAPPESAAQRYRRAAQRRLKGVAGGAARGARRGWFESAADPEKRRRAGR